MTQNNTQPQATPEDVALLPSGYTVAQLKAGAMHVDVAQANADARKLAELFETAADAARELRDVGQQFSDHVHDLETQTQHLAAALTQLLRDRPSETREVTVDLNAWMKGVISIVKGVGVIRCRLCETEDEARAWSEKVTEAAEETRQ